jgi:quercetin dioxygenase-like cupin family protein
MEILGRGKIVYGEDVDSLLFDWGTIKFLSEPLVTGAKHFSFGLVILEPGKGHDSHNHPGVEEIIFVVSGEGEQTIDGHGPVKIRPGASMHIPADVVHSTLNTGWEPLRLVVVYAPPGAERGLRDIPGCKVVPPN